MNNFSRAVVLAFLTLTTYTGLPTANASPFTVRKAAPTKAIHKETLVSYLDQETGALNSCYTIEYYQVSGATASPLNSAVVEPKPVSSVAQLVTYLKSQLPQSKVMIDPSNPMVINIIDNVLAQQKNYGLNKPIDIHYSGLLSALPKAIASATNQDINYLNTTDGAVVFIHADTARVNLSLKRTSGREVLTNATYSLGCVRQLWQAVTSPDNGAYHTSIIFPPPAH